MDTQTAQSGGQPTAAGAATPNAGTPAIAEGADSGKHSQASFDAGFAKAREKAEKESAALAAKLAEANARLAKLESIGKSPEQIAAENEQLKAQHATLETKYKSLESVQIADLKARAEKLPEQFRPIVLGSLDAGNVQDAANNLRSLEAAIGKTPVFTPPPGVVPNVASSVPLDELDRAQAAGDTATMKSLYTKYGENAIRVAYADRAKAKR